MTQVPQRRAEVHTDLIQVQNALKQLPLHTEVKVRGQRCLHQVLGQLAKERRQSLKSFVVA